MNGLKKMCGVGIFSVLGAGSLLAQGSSSRGSEGAAVGGLIVFLLYIAIILLLIIAQWKIFTKAGKPGWAILIPIYNFIVVWQISKQPVWVLILCFVPFVGFIGGIMLAVGIANSFGKGIGFALGLIFLPFIFYPLLAFGDAQYQG